MGRGLEGSPASQIPGGLLSGQGTDTRCVISQDLWSHQPSRCTIQEQDIDFHVTWTTTVRPSSYKTRNLKRRRQVLGPRHGPASNTPPDAPRLHALHQHQRLQDRRPCLEPHPWPQAPSSEEPRRPRALDHSLVELPAGPGAASKSSHS